MAPRIAVCRKGDDIFLTVEGDYTCESFRELLSVVRQLLMTSLKCAAPGSQVTYSIKTRGKVDLEKIAHFQQAINDQPYRLDLCEDTTEGAEQGDGPAKRESPTRLPRNGLILVKGGAL